MCFNWKEALNSLGPVLPIYQVGWACSGCEVVITIIMTDSKISLIKDNMELNLLASRLASLELYPLAFFFFLMKLLSNIYLSKHFLGFFRIITQHHYSFILFFLWLYLYCHLTQSKSSLSIRVQILYIKGIHFNQFSTFEFFIFIFTRV